MSTQDTPDVSDLSALTEAASDTFSVRRVFGEAYQQEGTLVIPVAVVTGTHGRAGAGGRGRLSDGRTPPSEAEDSPEQEQHPHAHHRWHPHGGQARGIGRAGAGGFATHTRPLGVYVVRDGEVDWQPALDLNRVILGGQVVGAVIGAALAITLPIAAALRRRGR